MRKVKRERESGRVFKKVKIHTPTLVMTMTIVAIMMIMQVFPLSSSSSLCVNFSTCWE